MKIDSPVKRFPGHVILPDFLNIRQVRAFEDALPDLNEAQADENKRVWFSVADEKRLPVLFMVVSEWHIEGVPEHPTLDTFPMTPLKDAHSLIEWIFAAVRDLWLGETTVPNE